MIRKKVTRQISNPRGSSKKSDDPFTSLFTSSIAMQPGEWAQEKATKQKPK